MVLLINIHYTAVYIFIGVVNIDNVIGKLVSFLIYRVVVKKKEYHFVI